MTEFRRLMGVIILVGAAVAGISACSRADDPTPTLAPTAELSTPLASPSATSPPTNTPTPATPTPQPTPTPCQFPLQPDIAEFWSAGLLGCPTDPGAAAISTAYAPFEGGQMLWRGDTEVIFVLTGDGRWTSFANAWREGDPVFTCGDEDPATTPIRGFGRVWCEGAGVRQALGNATAEEIGDSASAVQDFGNGAILIAPFGGVFVFVNEDSTWRQVDE